MEAGIGRSARLIFNALPFVFEGAGLRQSLVWSHPTSLGISFLMGNRVFCTSVRSKTLKEVVLMHLWCSHPEIVCFLPGEWPIVTETYLFPTHSFKHTCVVFDISERVASYMKLEIKKVFFQRLWLSSSFFHAFDSSCWTVWYFSQVTANFSQPVRPAPATATRKILIYKSHLGGGVGNLNQGWTVRTKL